MSKLTRDAANSIIQLAKQCEKEPLKTRKLQALDEMQNAVQTIEKQFATTVRGTVSGIERRHLLKELQVDPTHLEKALADKAPQSYQGSIYGKIANIMFEPLTRRLLHQYPQKAERFHNKLMQAGIPALSITYVSMLFFTSFLILFIGSAVGVILFSIYSAMYGILFGFALTALAFFSFLFYPEVKAKQRRKTLDDEYPFIVTHLAAIANNVQGINMFKTLQKTSYYSCMQVELRRIVNYVSIFGYSLPDALRATAQTTPSQKVATLFTELAERIEKKQRVKQYLRSRAQSLVAAYSQGRGQVHSMKHHYVETGQVMRTLRFSWLYLFSISLAAVLIILGFLYLSTGLALIVLFIAVILGWSPIILDTYKITRKRKQLEAEFFHFVRSLRKKQSLLKLKGKFGILQPHVDKLQNQYRLGIPIDKALQTFARDTESPMVDSAIAMVLEAIKHKANLFQALDEITTSKMKRNLVKN